MLRRFIIPAVHIVVIVACMLIALAMLARAASADPQLDPEEQAFVSLINNYRAQNGLGPLSIDWEMQASSDWMSADLGINSYFDHNDHCTGNCITGHAYDPNVSRDPWTRMCAFGYCYNTWKGENIAGGFTTAQSVFTAWQNSPGHNANMLGANYGTMGIARIYIPGSPYGWYWTNDFGGVNSNATAPASATPTRSPTPSPTASPSATLSPTPTPSPSPSPLPTASPSPTPTLSRTPTLSPIPTLSPTSTPSPTPTPTTAPISLHSVFLQPTDGAIVPFGKTITMIASASGPAKITKIEFYVNGSRKCSDTSSPFTCSWRVPTSNGVAYTLEARAYDSAGGVATSVVHVVSGFDVTRPAVWLTNAGEGSQVPANSRVILSASAMDDVGVTKVEFYVNGSRKCSDSSSQYTCTWSVPATVGVAYTLEARAYDAAGNVGSAVVHVTSQ